MSTGTITEAKRGTGDDATVLIGDGREQRQFAKWFVTITTDDSKTVKTSILRKPSSPDPTGLQAEYNGKRWKLISPGGGNKGQGGGRSPQEQKSIVRQGAEQRAALYLIAKALVKQHLAQDLTREDFKKLCDWFVADAEGAS